MFQIGERVKTTQNCGIGGWSSEAFASRKWGVTGKVSYIHDAHGTCFRVEHDDGSHGFYDYEELERLT